MGVKMTTGRRAILGHISYVQMMTMMTIIRVKVVLSIIRGLDRALVGSSFKLPFIISKLGRRMIIALCG